MADASTGGPTSLANKQDFEKTEKTIKKKKAAGDGGGTKKKKIKQ